MSTRTSEDTKHHLKEGRKEVNSVTETCWRTVCWAGNTDCIMDLHGLCIIYISSINWTQ